MAGIRKVRAERAARREAERQLAIERRARARYLLFGVGLGRMKGLSYADRKFVNAVWRECYLKYLETAQNPISLVAHHRRWYGSQKRYWINYDVPRRSQKQFEELRRAAS